MKKGLVTAFVIASVLAFNACKKEEGPVGPAGPAGPQGPAGATGPQGPVGPAGASGADGTKILTGTTAPGASTGANGDYYFDSASKTLYGPKAGGAWPAGTSLEGAPGADGADGADGAQGPQGEKGTQFLAGAGAPDADTGNEGDYYFDLNTSTFYGPKSATPGSEWTVNVFPLASAYAAKTFYLSGTLNNVTETEKVVGHKAAVTYPHSGPSDEIQATGVYYNQEDMTRRASYPGWDDNREMIFETDPVGAPGVFDLIPQDGDPATWGPGSPDNLVAGRRFRFTQNFTYPTAEFNLTNEDIARITKDNGAFYDQYVYAKVINGVGGRTVAIGEPMYFFRTKQVTITNDATAYSARYTASTSFNLNNIPGLGDKIEAYKHDGKVYLKYRYVNPATGAPRFEAAPSTVGWVDLTDYVNGYSVAGVAYGPDGVYTTTASSNVAGVNPFAVAPYNPRDMAGLASTGALGAAGMTLTVSADNVLTQHSSAAPRLQVTNNGNFTFHWDIVSGSNIAGATTAVPFGPITLVNAAGILNPVAASWVGGTYNMDNATDAYWESRAFADTYYKAPSLTATVGTTGATFDPVTGNVNMIHHANGQPASYFQGKSVVQLQVFVVTGDLVKQATAAGINVNNPEALSNFANSLRLQ